MPGLAPHKNHQKESFSFRDPPKKIQFEHKERVKEGWSLNVLQDKERVKEGWSLIRVVVGVFTAFFVQFFNRATNHWTDKTA